MMENPFQMDDMIKRALDEDLGAGDLTTGAIVDPHLKGKAVLLAKEDLVLAGSRVFARVFELLDPAVVCRFYFQDGDTVTTQKIIGEISGTVAVLLTGERTALNFVQRMSGIATLTRHYVDQAGKSKTKIVDTRKTVPGLRLLDKYAVHVGGGHNHRRGLFDGILIKDNHIVAAGSITKAIECAKQHAPHSLKIEVEVQRLDQIEEAIKAGADIVLLDNMNLAQLKNAVHMVQGRVLLEASGGVNLDTVGAIAATGVDIISVGALTHSAKAVDISLELLPLE
ncbi:MAG: carboxylating nicotinate-nucleotide diphosphorylase [Desulfobacteraceae bacterium]|nr:MAG: carboxylating nicotinate-nucleotide diphosphorylase [Desulfobacteraceae bacterium]